MPGWHAATRSLEADGRLRNVGIIQEQHPERTRLFMQWRQMDWPILVDSLNLLGLEVVPVTLLLDEAGVVRYRGSEKNLERFLEDPPVEPRPSPRTAQRPELPTSQEVDALGGEALVAAADALFLWAGAERLNEAIDAYRRSIEEAGAGADTARASDAGDLNARDLGARHFRLGVAYRRRADSPERQAGDFSRAVERWGQALALEPNQYIWRRRIQQYGPRLEKPYSFYDWVETARRDLAERGEEPVELIVEPRGAELAQASREFLNSAADPAAEPPLGAYRIHRDAGLIAAETTVVPARITPGSSARVHLAFRPNAALEGHWNNEADDMEIWLEAPEGWKIDRRRLTVANPPQLVSDEDRLFELELQSPRDARDATLSGFALYYVCEDVGGTCLYRRQDLEIALPMQRQETQTP